MTSFATSSECDEYTSDSKASDNLSRRSVDWRDSGIVIDEDQHHFNSFETLFHSHPEAISTFLLSHAEKVPVSTVLDSKYRSPSGAKPQATNYCPTQRIVLDEDDDGDTILHLAVVGCHIDKVRDLIKLCDLNSINNMMQTPLHVAVLANRPEMVQLLIDSDAQVDVHDRRGNTPLHLACQKGHQEIIEILLQKNEEHSVQQRIELTNFDGQTCLHLATSEDRRQIIELLVNKYQADVNCRDSKSGETILHKAIVGFNVDLVAFILSLEKHCNTADYSGREPLETIEVLKNSRIDRDQMQTLASIENLVKERIERCIESRGCCLDRSQDPFKTKESLDSASETSSSDYSDSDYELS